MGWDVGVWVSSWVSRLFQPIRDKPTCGSASVTSSHSSPDHIHAIATETDKQRLVKHCVAIHSRQDLLLP